jgi:hypothetical protein
MDIFILSIGGKKLYLLEYIVTWLNLLYLYRSTVLGYWRTYQIICNVYLSDFLRVLNLRISLS